MLGDVHVMGPYWRDDAALPSLLGGLVMAAKDHRSPEALADLERRIAAFVHDLELDPAPLVLAVPPGPARVAHPVPALAAAVADQLRVGIGDVLEREHATVRLRGTPIDRRREIVEAAGYRVNGDVAGRSVLLVDDVVLTGTTLGYLAELLVAAGARRVDAVVVCRTRLADDTPGS